MIKIIILLSLVVLFVVIKIVLSNIIRLSSLKEDNEDIIQKIKDAAIKNKYLMALLQDKHKVHSKRGDLYNTMLNNIDVFKDKLSKLQIESEQLQKKLNDLTIHPKNPKPVLRYPMKAMRFPFPKEGYDY